MLPGPWRPLLLAPCSWPPGPSQLCCTEAVRYPDSGCLQPPGAGPPPSCQVQHELSRFPSILYPLALPEAALHTRTGFLSNAASFCSCAAVLVDRIRLTSRQLSFSFPPSSEGPSPSGLSLCRHPRSSLSVAGHALRPRPRVCV